MNSITSNTLSGENTQKLRTASNRVQAAPSGLDELSRNRFNQSYNNTSTVKKTGIILHSRNAGQVMINHAQSTNQSIEKTSLSRSRNKKQLNAHNTTQAMESVPVSMIDMTFKANPKQVMSVTNNQSLFMNSSNIQALKQQILAQKKATNLLMKGISPLKK